MLPRLQLIGAAVLFSTGGAAIKLTHLASWQIACFRSLIAFVALIAFVPETRVRWTPMTWLASISYCGALLFFVLATKLTSAANAIFLQAAAPLYVLILSPWLLKERLRTSDFALMAALAGGLALTFLGQPVQSMTAPNPALGNILGSMSGVAWGLTIIALRYMSRGSDATAAIRTAAGGNLITFLVCLPVALSLPLGSAGVSDWFALGYLGLFQVALAYIILIRGISKVPAVESSALLLAESALNPVWAWIFAGEAQPALAVAGGTIILSAMLVNLWWKSRRESAVLRSSI
ncbi:MAG TPA: DMT family transporter [Bryobacteraceae bacterium]|jgi:drug/metabolite transporter (DMT)-like permease